MATFNRRLASKSEYFQLFLVCVFPVHVWAILTLLKWASNLILPLDGAEVISVAAYVLFFALLESLFLFGLLFILSLILPPGFLQPRLVPAGTVLVLLGSISAALIHMYEVWEFENIKFDEWTVLWILVGLLAAAALIGWARREPKVEGVIRSIAERLAVMSVIYLFFDFLGTFIVLFRNLF